MPDSKTTDPLTEWWENSVFRKCLVDTGTSEIEVDRIGIEIKGKVPAMITTTLDRMGLNDVVTRF